MLEELESIEIDKRYIYSRGPLIFRLGQCGIAPGDKRISYRGVATHQRATLIGVPDGNAFTAFISPNGLTLHHLFAWTLNDAVNTMRHEFVKARRQTRIVMTIVQLIV